jgi:hypothetical protein
VTVCPLVSSVSPFGAASTVKFTADDFVGSPTDVAEMLAVPAETGVITPVDETVATAGLPDDQVTVVLLLFTTVAVAARVGPPTHENAEFAAAVTIVDTTLTTTAAFTFGLLVNVAVKKVVPSLTAVMRPAGEMVAMSGRGDGAHVTALSVDPSTLTLTCLVTVEAPRTSVTTLSLSLITGVVTVTGGATESLLPHETLPTSTAAATARWRERRDCGSNMTSLVTGE